MLRGIIFVAEKTARGEGIFAARGLRIYFCS